MRSETPTSGEGKPGTVVAEKTTSSHVTNDFKLEKDVVEHEAPENDRRSEYEDIPEGVQILKPGYDAREDLTTLQVLIVDDNRFHRSLIRNALASQGIHTHWEAEDAKSAERLMSEQDVDLIILDNNMPGEKGAAFTRRLRRKGIPGNPCTPVIMVSAYGDEGIIMAARNSGVHEYILKPFNIVTLLKRIVSTFKYPRDFVIAPEYVGPDRRWEQKLNAEAKKRTGDDSRTTGLRKPEVVMANG